MSLTILDSESSLDQLRLRFRRSRSGPELELVDSFLRDIPLAVPRGCRSTVFREPCIESGFPDLVIVVWRESVARNWNAYRRELEPHDLRVMHYIYNVGRANKSDLQSYFGSRAMHSVERLAKAEMVRTSGEWWLPCSLQRIFAAVKIIAVEAKMDKWTVVLNQALLNTWFASKSYVLVPKSPNTSQLAEAQQHGIGICSFSDTKVNEIESQSTQLPRSYASWLFNEWAWRGFENAGGWAE